VFDRFIRWFGGKGLTTIATGQSAPLFALPDLQGKEHRLADALKKGPVVLAFYKISCPVCQYALPFLERIHEAYGNDRVSFWGISQDDSRDTREFCEEYGLTFPTLVDGEGYPTSNQYGLTNVPTVLMIESSGKVVSSGHGFDREQLLAISAHLGKQLSRTAAPVFHPDENVPDYKPG